MATNSSRGEDTAWTAQNEKNWLFETKTRQDTFCSEKKKDSGKGRGLLGIGCASIEQLSSPKTVERGGEWRQIAD